MSPAPRPDNPFWRSLLARLLGAGAAEWRPTQSSWLTLPLPDGRPLSVWSADLYQDPLAGLIRRAKYGADWASAQAVARGCARVSGSGLWGLQPILVPVPCDPARLGPRGFHLPVLIAREVAQARGCRLRRTGLVKLQSSPVQAGLSREERLVALRGIFQASPPLRGQRVVLVDDVLTTGATLSAARLALEAVGAEVVGAVVAGRVPGGGAMAPTLGIWTTRQTPKSTRYPRPRPRPSTSTSS